MLVSVTRLRLRRWLFLPRFAAHTLRSRKQVRSSPGFFNGCFAIQLPLTFWTITVWADDVAMRGFRNHGDHAKAMRHLMRWCDEASYVHFEHDGADIPTADILYERLKNEGKLTKVSWPSEAHAAGEKAGRNVPRLAGKIVPARGRSAEA